MLSFIKKIIIAIVIPLLIILSAVIIWDPFKVFFTYEDYYNKNYVTGNREAICLHFFNSNSENKKMNSFIIGNSRSLVYRIEDWQPILIKTQKDSTIHGFHFDGSGLGLYRMKNILSYLSARDTIKNLLLMMDNSVFDEISNPKTHITVEPPELSHESAMTYYYYFVKASTDPSFIYANLDIHLTKKYKPYMQFLINRSRYFNLSNNKTGDFYFGYDKEIAADSIAYYHDKIKQGIFFTRNSATINKAKNKDTLNEQQLDLLNEIQQICIKNKTHVKIVISPLYDEVPFNTHYKNELISLFGAKNVFDFSGKNSITENISNYYETSHYKVNIAREIMDSIYNH